MIHKNPSGHLPVVQDLGALLLDQAASDPPLYADIRQAAGHPHWEDTPGLGAVPALPRCWRG